MPAWIDQVPSKLGTLLCCVSYEKCSLLRRVLRVLDPNPVPVTLTDSQCVAEHVQLLLAETLHGMSIACPVGLVEGKD